MGTKSRNARARLGLKPTSAAGDRAEARRKGSTATQLARLAKGVAVEAGAYVSGAKRMAKGEKNIVQVTKRAYRKGEKTITGAIGVRNRKRSPK